jgi:hypothetical protein
VIYILQGCTAEYTVKQWLYYIVAIFEAQLW